MMLMMHLRRSFTNFTGFGRAQRPGTSITKKSTKMKIFNMGANMIRFVENHHDIWNTYALYGGVIPYQEKNHVR